MNEPLDIIFTDGDISGPSAPFRDEKNEPTGIEADKRTIQAGRARETDRCRTVLQQIDIAREAGRTKQSQIHSARPCQCAARVRTPARPLQSQPVRGLTAGWRQLWDTAGQEAMESLRELAYPKSHVILLGYNTSNSLTLEHAQSTWQEELRGCADKCPITKNAPRILVGTMVATSNCFSATFTTCCVAV